MSNSANQTNKNCIEIQNTCLISPFQEIPGGNIQICDGKITGISKGPWVKRGSWLSKREDEGRLVIDAGGNYLTPGFIDLHVHGSGGWDVMDGTGGAINSLAQSLSAGGTTAFLPTVMTGPPEQIIKSLKSIAVSGRMGTDGAGVLGVHLEGPFLNRDKAGVHPTQFLSEPSVELLEEFYEASGGIINIITVAPELSGAEEILKWARSRGILCSVGHSMAAYEQIAALAEENVLTMATHTFNGMEPFHHRHPGVVGAVLTIDKLQAEVIPDPAHIHPVTFQLLLKAKGLTGVHIVTDANRSAGLPDGQYEFAGDTINVRGGKALTPDGTVAGSTLTMAEAVRNAMLMGNLSFCQAVQLATINPARLLGMGKFLGSLEIGKSADLVILDSEMKPLLTMAEGNIVYQA